jgi:catechol-2,3-dioxygenase
MPVQRLNHAVLYVASVAKSVEFYTAVLGMTVAHEFRGAAFLRCANSANDHDLGLFEIGGHSPGPGQGRRGLYHLAWQVDTINDLATIGQALSVRGAMAGSSDHGASKSLYAVDPDGVEIEIMWAVPRNEWPTDGIGVQPLAMERELTKWAGISTGHEANVIIPATP